jgi:hypothetical protein
MLTSFDRNLNLRWPQVALPAYFGDVTDAVIVGAGGTLYVATSDNASQGAVDAFGPP